MKRFVLAIALGWSISALALEGNAPNCVDNNGRPLPVNNQQVVQYKQTTRNEFHARAHVSGSVTQLYPNLTGHQHFQITLDGTSATLEVVYEMDFGKINNLQVGASVEACGDYITSNAPYQGFPVSPDGALIHWVHRSDSNHPQGFVIVNNVVYGQN